MENERMAFFRRGSRFTLLEVLLGGLLTALIMTLTVLLLHRGINFHQQQNTQWSYQRQASNLFSQLGRDLRMSSACHGAFMQSVTESALRWRGNKNKLVLPVWQGADVITVVYAVREGEGTLEKKGGPRHNVTRIVKNGKGTRLNRRDYADIGSISFSYAETPDKEEQEWQQAWSRPDKTGRLPDVVRVDIQALSALNQGDNSLLSTVFSLPEVEQ